MSVVGKPGYKETEIGWIPLDWESKTLAECAVITMGQSPAGNTYNFEGVGKPLLNGPTEFTNRYPVKIQWTSSPTKLCQPGDILICVRGSSTGRMNIANDEYCIGRGLASIRYRTGYSQDFLIHLLHHSISEILKSAVGSTFPSIDGKAISSIGVPTPPFSEQQNIAAILTTIDHKLNVISRQIGANQSLKHGLMQTLFSRGVGNQDAAGRWEPHTEFKDSELGEIPTAWEVVEIQAIAEVIRGASPRPQGDPRYFGGNVPRLMGADVTRDGKWVTPQIDFLTEEGAKRSRPCPKGTLTIICSGDVGIPSFLAVDACIHDGFLALINVDESRASKAFLYHVIFSLKQKFDSSATHGGVFTNLTTGILKEFQIPLPSLNEQIRIASILDAADEKINTLTTSQSLFKTLKRGLMQKLLTGEWRVSLDPPAPPTETAHAT